MLCLNVNCLHNRSWLCLQDPCLSTTDNVSYDLVLIKHFIACRYEAQ